MRASWSFSLEGVGVGRNTEGAPFGEIKSGAFLGNMLGSSLGGGLPLQNALPLCVPMELPLLEKQNFQTRVILQFLSRHDIQNGCTKD